MVLLKIDSGVFMTLTLTIQLRIDSVIFSELKAGNSRLTLRSPAHDDVLIQTCSKRRGEDIRVRCECVCESKYSVVTVTTVGASEIIKPEGTCK